MLSIMTSVAVSASVESLVWAAARVKKKVDEIFYGTILVRIMHSQLVVISVKMTQILGIKFDRKDLVKHSK